MACCYKTLLLGTEKKYHSDICWGKTCFYFFNVHLQETLSKSSAGLWDNVRESLDDLGCTTGAHSSHAWTGHLKSVGRGRIRSFLTKKDLSPSQGIIGLEQTGCYSLQFSLSSSYSYSPQTWISTLTISASSLLHLVKKDWNIPLSIQFRNIYQQYSSGA